MKKNEKACQMILVRVAPSDKQAFQQAANESADSNLSKWIKDTLHKAIREKEAAH